MGLRGVILVPVLWSLRLLGQVPTVWGAGAFVTTSLTSAGARYLPYFQDYVIAARFLPAPLSLSEEWAKARQSGVLGCAKHVGPVHQEMMRHLGLSVTGCRDRCPDPYTYVWPARPKPLAEWERPVE